MKSKPFYAALMIALAVGVYSTAAFAQRPAAAKARGDAYNFYSGQTWGNSAYEQARILNQYSASGAPVPKAVVQEHATAIRSNVEGARRAYSGLSEKTKNDPEAKKQLAEIEKHHAKALEICDKLDAECAKPEGDSVAVCSCCTDVEKELKAADAAHQELTKKLKVESYLPAKK